MSQQREIRTSSLLASIKDNLGEYSAEKSKNGKIMSPFLEMLTEKLERSSIDSQILLEDIVHNHAAIVLIKERLYISLLKHLNAHQIRKLCQHNSHWGENKVVLHKNVQMTISQILENINIIQEEIMNLQKNVADFMDEQPIPIHCNDRDYCNLSTKKMIQIIVDDGQTQVEESLNQLLFRMYILEESIELIFCKTKMVTALIKEDLNAHSDVDRLSCRSSKSNKRSALSESIEIFIENKQKKELVKYEPKGHASATKMKIPTDYQIVQSRETKPKPTSGRIGCCFWS